MICCLSHLAWPHYLEEDDVQYSSTGVVEHHGTCKSVPYPFEWMMPATVHSTGLTIESEGKGRKCLWTSYHCGQKMVHVPFPPFLFCLFLVISSTWSYELCIHPTMSFLHFTTCSLRSAPVCHLAPPPGHLPSHPHPTFLSTVPQKTDQVFCTFSML